MTFRYISIALLLAFALSSASTAQVRSAASASTAVVPELDDLDKAWVQNVQLAQKLYEVTCQGLPLRQQLVTLQSDTLTKIEARHPGFTMDWPKGVLVQKPAGKAPLVK